MMCTISWSSPDPFLELMDVYQMNHHLRLTVKSNHTSANPIYQISRKQFSRWCGIHLNQLNVSETADLERCFKKYLDIRTVYGLM